MSLTKGACTYRLSVCLASCAVCMQACECCVRARVRFSVACMGAYVRVFVSACVRVSVARQHACVCTCQCCTPTCVRVLRACMCTCRVMLHVKYNDRKCRQQNTEHASNAKSVSVINKIWRRIMS